MRTEDIPRYIDALNVGCSEMSISIGALKSNVIENSELLNIRMDKLEQKQVELNNNIEYIIEYLCDAVDIVNRNTDATDETDVKVESLLNDVETIRVRLKSLDKNLNVRIAALESKFDELSEPKYIFGIDLASGSIDKVTLNKAQKTCVLIDEVYHD